jgi:endonuclease-3
MAASAEAKRHAASILRCLAKQYPDATCSLNFKTPLELLVATILSAQCTDQRVNLVTQTLFKKYPTAADFAKVPIAQLERDIQSTGFFRNKAKNIQACCRALLKQHQGEVPQEMAALVALAGVGRKTANVVLGTAFGIASGVVVDTHVSRLSHRMGLSQEKDPEKIERDLMEQIPSKEWIALSHRMIQLGRQFCMAKKPNCEECPMKKVCPKIGVENV